MMYPYHNTIKKRIKNDELVSYEFVDNYKNIGKCMLLHFNTSPFVRPIRPYKYHEYADMLAEWKERQKR